jgi:hypothetical protein
MAISTFRVNAYVVIAFYRLLQMVQNNLVTPQGRDCYTLLTHNILLELFKLIRVLVSVLSRNPVDHNY